MAAALNIGGGAEAVSSPDWRLVEHSHNFDLLKTLTDPGGRQTAPKPETGNV